MGSWGAGSFENDDAGDWVVAFSDEPGLDTIIEALTAVTESDEDEYLELPECGAAVAAAEVVAALKGRPNPQLPKELSAWVNGQSLQVDEEMTNLAIAAIRRIKSNSEMQELWAESQSYSEWQAALDDLEQRLRAAGVA